MKFRGSKFFLLFVLFLPLSIVISGLISSPACANGYDWEWLNPLPQGEHLRGVWGSSGSDVFAVGWGGAILHYNGSEWTVMDSGTTNILNNVWGSSVSDVFAVGMGGTILHYDGSEWIVMDSGTTYDLSDVWGSSGSNVFAVGEMSTLLHYNGSEWTVVDPETTVHFSAIWGSSGSDIFAVGHNYSHQGTILHYDGSTWSVLYAGSWRGTYLYSIWGSSGSDVFVFGYDGPLDEYPNVNDFFTLHYNGSEWTREELSISSRLYGLWGSSGSDVFASGDDGTILHYDGSSWTEMDSGTTVQIRDVWGSSGNNVFAVGAGGIILHYNGSTWSPMVLLTDFHLNSVWSSSASGVFAVGTDGTILHYDGSTWSEMESGTTNNLKDIWGSSGSNIFAVGEDIVLHYNGSTWSSMGSLGDINGIWGISGSSVYAVGEHGRIYHYDGSAWSTVDSGISGPTYYDVWGSSENDVFIVGDEDRDNRAFIIHFDGTEWTRMDQGQARRIYAIWGSSGNSVFAAGDFMKDHRSAWIFLHYDGSEWTTVDPGTGLKPHDIWGSSENDVYAVGNGGSMFHYDGSEWTAMDTQLIAGNINGIWGNSAVDIYAVGGYGRIVHSDFHPESVTLTADRESPAELSTVGTVTFTSEASGSTGIYEYQFWMYRWATSVWEIVQEYSSDNTYYWTPYQADRYLITVWARNAGSSASYEVKKGMIFNIVDNPPVESVTLTADKETPAGISTVGTVTFTAEAAGGSNNYEYQFWMYRSSTSVWEIVQDYSADNTYVWTPDEVDTYWITVWTRNVGSSANYEAKKGMIFNIVDNPPVESVTLTADKESPAELSTVGTVTFTAEATGGSNNYEYQFWSYCVSARTWEIVQEYSDSNIYYWTPEQADTCYIAVWARNVGSSANYEAKKGMLFNIIDNPPVESVTLTADKESPAELSTVGTVTFTAEATGGSNNYEYQFWMYNTFYPLIWEIVQEYSDSNIYYWTPDQAGTYWITVWTKNAGSAVNFEAKTTIMFEIVDQIKDCNSIPDTGQTGNYTAIFGEDSDYTINPPSYTDNGNGTVTDNVTCLMWQQEDDNQGYNWYEASGTYDATYNPGTTDVCGSLTLAGYTDWRLPDSKELHLIVDNSQYAPAIDSTVFPNTNNAYYWSSTPYEGYAPAAWYVDFGVGDVSYYLKTDNFYYVRCVRGGQSAMSFTANGDGTVTDNVTGLMWQQEDDDTTRKWESAITYCENLVFPPSTYSDWRLPNINELYSIADISQYNPAIDSTVFPNTNTMGYWSSTAYSAFAWYVYFSSGGVHGGFVPDNFEYVRCVRGGQ